MHAIAIGNETLVGENVTIYRRAASPTPPVSPEVEKAAYMRGWNDRENEFLGRAEMILPQGSVSPPGKGEG